MVVDHRRDARERRVEKGELRRGLERLLVERRVEPPPDLLEDLPEGARRLRRGPASRARAPNRGACGRSRGRAGRGSPTRRASRRGSAPRRTSRRSTAGGSSATTVPPVIASPPRLPDSPAGPVTSRAPRGAGGPRLRRAPPGRPTSDSERCASSSATVLPCCSTHVKYFRLCQRSRFSTVPSVIQSSFWPWKIDARCASAFARVSGARRLLEAAQDRRVPVEAVRRHGDDGVALAETRASFAVRIAPRMLQTPLIAEERREPVRGLAEAALGSEEVAPDGLGDELQPEQALLVVDRHHGVHVRDVVDPRDVLVADALDRVAAVAVPRERRALDRLEADDLRPEARLERVARRDRARRAHGRDEGRGPARAERLDGLGRGRAGDVVVPAVVRHLVELVHDARRAAAPRGACTRRRSP